jgi:Flagellar capping protein
MTAIQTAITTGSYDKSLSNASVARVTLGTTVLEGSYDINVTALGSSSTALSKAGLITVTDPSTQNISASSNYTLVIDGVNHPITAGSNTLNALASAINNDATAGVSATIVNMGNSGTPDYRLSLQAKKLGAVTIDLTDAGGSIIDPISTGTKATYQLNGVVTSIETDSRTITLAPGITVDLLATGDTTIGISRSLTSVSNALISFATAYNGAVGELDKHRGEGGGALAGQSLISSLSDALRKISGYTPVPVPFRR